jgi:hypothetical protein
VRVLCKWPARTKLTRFARPIFKSPAPPQYQEEVAEFFRGLGLEATTDHTVQGVRTKHAIDVYVKSHHVGFDVVWLVSPFVESEEAC